MHRILTLVVAIVLVLLCGAIHGVWTDRWEVAQDLRGSIAALERVPKDFGNWEGQTFELPEDQLQVAGIAAHFACRYIHRQNGNVISVLLVCGRPGPIAVHPPEVCYEGQGFALMHAPEKQSVLINDGSGPDSSAEFSMARFQKGATSVPQTIRVFWSWSATGAWQVPSVPRITFARNPALFKLYIVRELSTQDEPETNEPIIEFLREFLPELNRTLFNEGQ